jgi:hypothetical protein
VTGLFSLIKMGTLSETDYNGIFAKYVLDNNPPGLNNCYINIASQSLMR